jgi:[glutamine synthetase] adenylyltransferase / [glutamine synthetase]-adenylyl-L-tyrosine phosphorylase
LSEPKPPNESTEPRQTKEEAGSAPGADGASPRQVFVGAPLRRAPWQLDQIPLLDRPAAHLLLTHIAAQVSPGLAAALPALLAETPDPDSALMMFDRLVSQSPEIPRLLDRHNSLAHYALMVLGHSRYLGETLIHNADLLQSFLRERNLDRSFSREEFHETLARYRSRSFENDVSLLLARFKRREYIRILLRDVLKIAPLAETTAEISALAHVLIEEALREAENRLQRRYESPQHLDPAGRLVDTPFTVLSLGKLGGNELNYSSDVDLIYLFGDGKEPPDARIANREYFIRLAQQVTEILSLNTKEGPVFRIDLRLRPQGNEGELAIGLSEALRYYAVTAHDWERQALIKVRYSAGNLALAREFVRGVQPHVYTAQVNFAAIKTALVAREKMHQRRPYKKSLEMPGESINVKVDRGGIRDIEFLVQCLQRVYGGEEPWLRSGGTLFSLHKLHDKRHITGKEFHDLTSAYEFLRHLEHRLQLRQGQQTHRLPLSGPELAILQRAMEGYEAGQFHLGNLVATVRRRMVAVAEIYQRIIYQQQARRYVESVPEDQFQLQGTLEPGPGDQSSQQILERMAADAPHLYEIVSGANLTIQGRKNLFRFLGAAFASSERYATVLRHPQAMARALLLFETSEYLTDILVRYPGEISALANWDEAPSRRGVGHLFVEAPGVGPAARGPMVDYLSSSQVSYGEKLSLLRQHYRQSVFISGARDVNQHRNVYQSLRSTTAAAEDAVAAAFGIAGRPDGLAVMALGRLGAGEFDVLSDADLLFVCEEGQDRQGLAKSVAQFMEALSAYTRHGMVFPVDARLRPQGGEGELIFTPARLGAYCEQEAQAWEALTYTKLRFVAGSPELGARAMRAAEVLFQRFAAEKTFREAAQEMRTRLEPERQENNFKTSPGAIYDIDFITGVLLVTHGVEDKSGSLHDRLWRCAAAGLLDNREAATLDHAAELFRTVDHLVRLVVGRAQRWLPATEHAQQVTLNLAGQILGREFPYGLESELLRAFAEVRRIFNWIC